MKHARLPLLLLAAALAATLFLPACQRRTHSAIGATGGIEYPAARKGAQADDYHGTMVLDPYRWMEDLDSPELAAWIAAENDITFAWLKSIPERKQLRRRLEQLWNYERFGPPTVREGRYYYTRNDGLQNQSVLYVQEGMEGRPQVLLDPNRLSKDGTVALGGRSFSEDGRYMAFSLPEAGSDWADWHVMDTQSRKRTGDHLTWTKFTSVAWTHDGAGFYYARYPEPASADFEAVTKKQMLYYHKLGTDQSEDLLVYERPDQPTWGFGPIVTPDGKWLAIHGSEGTHRKARYWYMSLAAGPKGKVKPLMQDFDAMYSFVGSTGRTWFFFTNADAPRGRVIAVDLDQPGREAWRTVIPETADTLRSVQYLNGSLVANYLHDAHSRIVVHGTNGSAKYEVQLPGLGTTGGLSGHHDQREAFFSFSSFTQPAALYRIDLADGSTSVFRQPTVDFAGADYETKQVWYTSKDGTRVPMFLVHRKGLQPDGDTPTLLYGYGGFNIPITPSFSVFNATWIELGGIYAVASIRGGGEFGREWHQAGTVGRKQNCFDDFIAAAEWLVSSGYTRPERLAIRGGSNGGLLVGACINQRPELFGAALPAVGVMDMLRFHEFTIGWAWVSDYGSSADQAEFRSLYAYSPLHNIRPGTEYPAVLVTTADHDDRVVPSHSFKYTATLQEAQAGDAPVLIRVDVRAGHGAGKPTSKRIEEATDQLAFLVRTLGVGAPAF